ncbi:MAG: rRNA maturation RNAse YbeY [Gemmatimonadaceae bacterium]
MPLREELVRLVVHGTLHVLGYDHPDDASRLQSAMWKRQERLVALVLRSAGA